MTPDVARAFARYNRWMNGKVYDTAARLSDEERKRDRGAFFKSIHATLNHILLADRVWLGRLNGVKPEPGFMAPGIRALDQELHADFDALRDERANVDDAIDTYVRDTTADGLVSDLKIVRRGKDETLPTWWALTQMFNHQTHHRGQITTLLSQAGLDPGATDLFAMLMEERQRAT